MSAKPQLVLLSGLLCDAAVWQPVADRLADIAAPTIFAFPSFTSIPEMAAHVLAQTEGHFALAGHSMGGRVAMEIYAQAPARVERLALLNTGARPPNADEPAKRQVLLDIAREEGMAAVAAAWLPGMIGNARRNEILPALVEMVAANSVESFNGQIGALLSRPDATKVLPALLVKTLLISADEDGWSPTAQHAEMLTSIPRGELVEIGGCGHMSIVERPDAVAAAMREWLLG